MSDDHAGIVQQLLAQLKASLDLMIELEHMPPNEPDSALNRDLLDMENKCIRDLGKCYKLSEELRQALAPVWTPAVAQEIADMRSAIDTLRRRMRGSIANSFNHPILSVSDAPQEWKDDWEKHERFLWYMLNRLPALDIGSSSPQTTPPPQGGADSSPAGRDSYEDEDQQPPALTRNDRLALQALANFDSSFLASAIEVTEAIPAAERPSERTVRESIQKLVKLKWAERPEGNKRGVRLTLRGRRLAAKIEENRS